jgi:hypothetical protein
MERVFQKMGCEKLEAYETKKKQKTQVRVV